MPVPTNLASTPAAEPMALSLKERVKRRVPKAMLLVYRFFRTGEIVDVCSLLFLKGSRVGFAERWSIVRRLYSITYHVPCYHAQSELITPIKAILRMPGKTQGVVIEAGCFKGGSTAKLSLAAKATGREFFVFDSFEGIPENTEAHENNIWGGRVRFSKGDYTGAIEEVRDNVRRFGEVGVCHFVKGFFEDSMPGFDRPVVVAYLDVDLASSTRTCLKHLWPLLATGGILFSQDGHLPLVLEVFNDDDFWTRELQTSKPKVHGFGTSGLIWCQKN